MLIVNQLPPMWEEISAKFKLKPNAKVLFAWEGCIFNPSGVKVPPELIVHETVHKNQQNGNASEWWKRYLSDPQFRLSQEIPAHAAEYGAILQTIVNNRDGRRRALAHVAHKLSAPLYGRLISLDGAKKAILALTKEGS